MQIKRNRKRFNVICCGRRFGKNILLQDFAVETALRDAAPFAWSTPTYKMLIDDWQTLCNTLAPVIQRRSEQEKRITLINGGTLDFWSLDNPDAMRGRKYQRVVINEAAFVPALMNSWNMVIRPTLIDMRGDAYFSGTPKGMNDFYVLYNQTGDDWQNWQMPSSVNPHIPSDELEGLRETMLERAYLQEIEAQFLEDGGGIFRNVRGAAVAGLLGAGRLGHQYAIGADWGRSDDATVFCVVDTRTEECVCVDRMTDTDYATQRLRLLSLSARFGNAPALVETNSIGMPQLEELERMGVYVKGFQTTNASKAQIIDALALAFEQGRIKIPNDPVLIGELMAYQAERLPSGILRYGAPDGMHDDTVIALALAWWHGVAGQTWVMS